MLFGRLDLRRRQHEGAPLFDATQDVRLRIMREPLQKVGVFP